jgi:hypothetical protein
MEYYFPSSFYELYKQYSSSSISIATHTHALALFVLYLFVRFYRSKRSVAAASAGAVGTVKNNNINNSTDESKSSTSRSSHSSSSRRKSQSQETAFLNSKSSDDDDDDDDDDGTLLLLSQIEKDESLQQQLGSSTSTSRTKSTLAERRRFLIANKNNLNGTIQQLRSYIEWKNNHIDKKIQIKSTGDKDYDIWVESSLTAMKICDGEVENIVLPRIIRTHSNSNSNSEQHYIDRDGYRTFCVTPALMDNNLAKGSTYTQAVAIYLDRCLDPSENEMITILFDCRAGTGWSNNHVMKLIPFLKHFLKVLPPLVPERLQKAIVYPVPYTFVYIWSMLSKGLDPTTSKRVCILHGQCKIVAPPPSEQMKLHLYEDHMEELESSRIAGFKI